MVRTLILVGLLLATTSCRTQYTPQTVEVADPGPPQRVLPTITVIDPGMTPRRPLRYRVAPGQTEMLYVELVRAEAMEARGQGAQTGMPPVQLEVKMGPASGTREGFIHHPVAFTQVRLSKAADQLSGPAPAARAVLGAPSASGRLERDGRSGSYSARRVQRDGCRSSGSQRHAREHPERAPNGALSR